MKRIVILLSVLLVFITGCSVTRLDNKTLDESIDIILSDKQKAYNVNFDGYGYVKSYDVKNDSVIDINNPLNVVLEPKYKEETKKED